jgi:hypothetical protein
MQSTLCKNSFPHIHVFFFPFKISPIGDKKIGFSIFSANSANLCENLKKNHQNFKLEN